ncbi:hypothetical protein ACFSQE_16920 [Vogesella fluminis]|uniref:SMODS-associating 2TM beta-strand rich effector domain-containing protein n=1 Tax=Vogesella fluminis TaxID=1069161 RepID=A0ABQ3HCM3_9NEIS|nr:hypothetical protein [Vogesella fluminis]GHD82309.1 hypothetical protein GCM10011419_29650 [Vogesella fluminis]
MRKHFIRAAKRQQLLLLWWEIFIEDIRAPFFDTAARLQFFLLIALFVFILPAEGYPAWSGELKNTIRTVHALFYAFPVFLIFSAGLSIFKALSASKKHGQWKDSRFVFHQKRHLMTAVVTAEDNGKLFPFKVAGLPKHASVDLIVEIEKGFDDRNVRVQFVYDKNFPIMWDEYERHNMLCHVPDNETLYITTSKPSPSNPSTIKVFLMSWYAGDR